MPTLQVFDPAMCCSTGLCGPDPDAALVQFASDLNVLASEGVAVQRFNLGQEPEKFLAQPAVIAAINALGTGVLPLIVRDGRVLSHSRYPSLAELRALLHDAPEPADMIALDLSPGGCAPGSGCC